MPQSIDYYAHSDTGSGTIPWSQAPKFSPSSPNSPPDPNNSDPNARPIAYVANGSHGMWSSVGTFTYVDAIIVKLQDVTSDGGVYWDTQSSLTAINYPDTYSGSLNWLNYKGDWGNKGVTNCWWYAIHNECELNDGPIGPLRPEMSNLKRRKRDISQTLLEKLRSGDLPSQVLAVISPRSPSYTFYTNATGATFVSVEQTCASVTATTKKGAADPTYSYVSSYTYATAKAGTTQYIVTDVPPCGGSSFVSSYSIGLCTEKSNCAYGDRRDIRVYSEDPDVFGPQEAPSIIVHDLDNWVF